MTWFKMLDSENWCTQWLNGSTFDFVENPRCNLTVTSDEVQLTIILKRFLIEFLHLILVNQQISVVRKNDQLYYMKCDEDMSLFREISQIIGCRYDLR